MTWFWVLDVVCLLWVVAGAVLVVWLRNLSGAVMALSLTGLGMTMLFVVLGAPDVAHAEVVVGAIALPVLYLVAIGKCRTVVERDDESTGEDRELHGGEPVRRRWAAVLLSAGVFTGLVVAFTGLPDETEELPAVARRAMTGALPDFHTTEPVSAVVYGYRGMDTFGETFLLLAAVVGVMVLTRTREARQGFVGEERAADEEQEDVDHPPRGSSSDEARRAERVEEGRAPEAPETPDREGLGAPAPETAQAMSVVARTAVRVALPLLLVGGLYLVSQGYSPGGGFPAGAVLLGAVLLVHTAFGYDRVRAVVRPRVLEVVEMLGAAAIVGVLAAGLPLEGSFAANWIPLAPEQTLRSGGMLQAFSVSELVEVGAGLTIVVFSLLGMRHDWAEDDEDGEGDESGEGDA